MARRTLIQLAATILYNGNLSGFLQGKLYQGPLKQVCVPGLNCYSCPGALGACPLGSLQSALAGSVLRLPFYVLGLLLLFALLLGRIVCGWLCPFGFVQEILYRLPSPKLRKNGYTRRLSYLKYFIAIFFVLLVPLWHAPAFCKYICPAGTLEGALPLLAVNNMLRSALGGIFAWKFFLLIVLLLAAVFIFRPFCRFICPLGVWYGLFHKLSRYGITVDESACTHCGACIRYCRMDCTRVGDRECISCGECRRVCPAHAIKFRK